MSEKLKKETYKIELIAYFTRIYKKSLCNGGDHESRLTEDEFAGFLCSGIMMDVLKMVEEEFILNQPINKEQIEELKLLQKNSTEYIS